MKNHRNSTPGTVFFVAFIAMLVIWTWLFEGRSETEVNAASRRLEKTETLLETDWPQWRGVNRAGVSLERDLLKSWPKSGPKTIWRTSVGEGYSGMSVSKGKLYTLWDEKDAQYLFCLDADSGVELWRHKVDSNFMNQYGNGPRSSPAIDEDTVFAISSSGKLHAVSTATGTLIWTHNLAKEYGSMIPSIGYSSSPLLEGDKLFVEVGGKDNLAFMAFHKKTGEVIWTSQTDLPAYSSPLAMTVEGVRQIIFFSASGLFSVSPDDGKLFWKHPWESECPATGIPLNAVTPLFIEPDRVFISSGYGTVEGGAVLRIKQEDEKFNVVSVWKTKQMKNLINSSLIHQNHIYGFDGGILKCVDATTGEEKWKARGFQRGSLILADDHLIVLGERGRLALVEASPIEFREKAFVQILDGKCWTSPTLAGGRLYLRNNKEMLALDLTPVSPKAAN